MMIAIEALRAEIHRILTGRGVPPDEADAGVDMCVDAELRGHSSHGVRLLRNVLAEYGNGEGRRAPMRILHETAVSAQVDGGFQLSWFVHRAAIDIVAAKARDTGLAIVSVRNAGVSGALGLSRRTGRRARAGGAGAEQLAVDRRSARFGDAYAGNQPARDGCTASFRSALGA